MRFFIVLLTFLSACHSKKSTSQQQESVLASNPDPIKQGLTQLSAPTSFIDSVREKLEIPISQLRQRTLLDSVFFTGFYSNATFVGDTVIRFSNDFLGAILNYDDHKVCSNKMIFIFDSSGKKNTCYDIIGFDCDADGEYVTQTFRLYNSILETRKSYFPAEGDSITATTTKITRWRVNAKGILDSTGIN